MPPPTPAFTEGERKDMTAFLNWLAASRETVRADVDAHTAEAELDWSTVPWWEY